MRPARYNVGFSLAELLIVIACLAVLCLFLPGLMRTWVLPASRLNCTNSLKQIGLAFRTWSLDNSDHFPMEESMTNGGTMELIGKGAIFPHFQAMSNELSTPKVLVCPQEKWRKPARDFTTMTDLNLSYFLNIDSTMDHPKFVLSGDRNLTNKPMQGERFVRIATGKWIGWSKEMHSRKGNLSFCDGSVGPYTNGTASLAAALQVMGTATNRLAMP